MSLFWLPCVCSVRLSHTWNRKTYVPETFGVKLKRTVSALIDGISETFDMLSCMPFVEKFTLTFDALNTESSCIKTVTCIVSLMYGRLSLIVMSLDEMRTSG